MPMPLYCDRNGLPIGAYAFSSTEFWYGSVSPPCTAASIRPWRSCTRASAEPFVPLTLTGFLPALTQCSLLQVAMSSGHDVRRLAPTDLPHSASMLANSPTRALTV